MKSQSIVYDSIGIGYNATRCADPYLTERLYRLLNPESGKLYLDIGCGTGNYTIALAKQGVSLWGIDPSEKMLNEAKSKSSEVNWQFGAAENIPIQDNFFDGAIATLTIHHWNDINASFEEMDRVLKPGSRFLIFHSTPEQMNGYWLNHYFPNTMAQATRKMESLTTVDSALKRAGFKINYTENYFVKDDLQDLFLYSCKNKPHLCLDDKIRNGISTFALTSNGEEVEHGLKKLKADIDNNSFDSVKNKFENDHGDYLFILAEKF
jgi:SAM-dependent methyltransferase